MNQEVRAFATNKRPSTKQTVLRTRITPSQGSLDRRPQDQEVEEAQPALRKNKMNVCRKATNESSTTCFVP